MAVPPLEVSQEAAWRRGPEGSPRKGAAWPRASMPASQDQAGRPQKGLCHLLWVKGLGEAQLPNRAGWVLPGSQEEMLGTWEWPGRGQRYSPEGGQFPELERHQGIGLQSCPGTKGLLEGPPTAPHSPRSSLWQFP